ncbi:MAG: hypothetical protein JWP87_1959 [Labilithrix sp.]|nr:hypothetical protein [Labilithrix sp.]
MTGREFVVELERQGFVIRRRSRSFIWVARGDQTLMLDEDATIPDVYVMRLLGPRSRPPMSTRRGALSTRPSARPSARPSRRP